MSVVIWLIIIANVILGTIVFAKKPSSRSNIYFSLLALFLSLWAVCIFLEDVAPNENLSLILTKADFGFGLMAAVFFLLFSLNFPEISRKFLSRDIYILIGGLFLSVFAVSDFVVKKVSLIKQGVVLETGFLFFLYSLLVLVAIALGIIVLLRRLRKSSGIKRKQIFFVLTGITSVAIFSVISSFILPYLFVNNPSISRLGIYSIVLFVGFTTYAIIKHRLLNIRVIATEIMVVFINFILLVQALLSKTWPEGLIRGGFLLLTSYFGYLLIKSVISEIERRKEVEMLAEKLTVVNNNLLTLQHINNKMVSTLELHRVAQEIVESLSTELSWKGGFVSLVDEKKETINIAAISEKVLAKISPYLTRQIADYHLHLAKSESVLQNCIKKIEIEYSNDFYQVIKGALKKEIAQKIQKVLKIKTFACAPVVYRGQVIGAIVIGFDKKLAHITAEERKMISSIADQAAIAIENAKLYEEIEAANVKLKELDKLKNEFLSIASHQVRTPLSIMKGYLSLLRDKKPGQVSEKQQEHFIKNIQEANEQLINIINDFLNLSRIEQKRMKLEISKSDIKKIIDEVMERLSHEAELKKIKLDFFQPKEELPKINIDEPKIIEVITNLIDNAIKYSPEGGEVKVRVGRPDKRRLEISVKDNGIGIPESFRDKLFQKFSRAHNAIQAQPNGNGIGLFLVKKIIDAHRGSIRVKTKEGRGTVFTIELNYKSGLKPGEEVDANKLEKEGIIRYDEYKSEKPQIQNPKSQTNSND